MSGKDVKHLSDKLVKNAAEHRTKTVTDLIGMLAFFHTDYEGVPVKLLDELKVKLAFFQEHVQATIDSRRNCSRRNDQSKEMRL